MQFHGWYDMAGTRGVGILVGRYSEGQSLFKLQFRAVDAGRILSFDSNDPVCAVSEIGLIFCPWCGRRLEKWYAKYLDELSRLDLLISGEPNRTSSETETEGHENEG
jgi:hypothetical protein